MRPQFDERDCAIRAERIAMRESREGPRVGDFIEMLDGTLRRFTHKWNDGLQTTYIWQTGADKGKPADASFHLSADGSLSFSGSLDSSIPFASIEPTGETRDGAVWFFHHGEMKAHNGVHTTVPCRVYRQIA